MLCSVAGFCLFESLTESQEQLALLKREEAVREREVAALQKTLDWQTAYKRRAMEDEFFFREVRERLNYAAPGEIIIEVK